ncbi:MAG: Fe-S cluster assembly protein SufB [Thermoplasmata archaeon]
MALEKEIMDRDYSKYGFRDDIEYVYKAPKGLSEKLVRDISLMKREPEWMLDLRLRGYRHFLDRPTPNWGGDLSGVSFDDISYYLKPSEKEERSWEEVPEKIRKTFDRLGIPEAERKFLAGVGAQYDSEVVYHSTLKELEEKGVIFMGTDAGLKEYPEIFEEYFGTLVPPEDNKFAALNTAVWSGGSFVYVPKGVKLEQPLQAYFRINSENMGQFERTLIIGEEDCQFHYIEGCTAPTYTTNSLHAAVVEVIAKPGSKVRYTTLQNWSDNVYNLVTKRAYAHENSTVEWVDANIGSALTMKYPSVYLIGRGAKAEILSVAMASRNQHQDAGAKAIHLAPDTQSRITSKSVSRDGGRVTYRGHLSVAKGATNVKSSVRCDALMIDAISRSDTYPYMDIEEDDATITHEATVGRISEDVLYYLMSRGLTEGEAMNMVVLGFLEVFTKELPMEYAVEFNRLIRMEIEGDVG